MLDVLLWPAEQAYAGAVALRNLAYDRGVLTSVTAGIPVVSIGNFTVGGTGKTPFAAWLVGRLRSAGERPAVVLRGYGEDEVQVHRELNAGGDVFVARRRVDGVRAATDAGCTVAVLDDAFQHRGIRRQVDIALVSAEGWLRQRRRLLPRGPWREPLTSARRADVVVVTRKSASEGERELVVDELRERIGGPVTVAACDLLPLELIDVSTGRSAGLEPLAGLPVVAVAGLADPEPFVRQLSALGAIPELIAFPDHHKFTAPDAEAILARARGRTIVMTLKDAVKLRELLTSETPAYVLRQTVIPSVALESALTALFPRLARRRS